MPTEQLRSGLLVTGNTGFRLSQAPLLVDAEARQGKRTDETPTDTPAWDGFRYGRPASTDGSDHRNRADQMLWHLRPRTPWAPRALQTTAVKLDLRRYTGGGAPTG